MVSSHVCNASVSELVKITDVIGKLLSGESTVLTQWGGALGTWLGKQVRPKSEWKGTFSEWDELIRSLN